MSAHLHASFLRKRFNGFLCACLCAFAAHSVQAQSLQVLLSPPGVQNTEIPGASVETFGTGASASIAGSSGTWAVGGFSATTGSLSVADQYGGAGGADRYLQVQGGPINVNLTPGYEYVGFWWSAGDASNVFTFYDNAGNELIRFTTADIQALLSGSGTITAINGTAYPKSSYFGNPNGNFSGQNSGEPYAYVNLILNNSSVKFGSIKIEGSNFELDNLSLAHPLPAPPGTWVPVSDNPVKLTANNDSYATVAGQPVPGNVATNDPAPTDTTAVYAVATAPVHGTLSGWDPVTGAFTYTPAAGFTGTDTFTYTRCRADRPAICDTATVTLTVVGATADSAVTRVDTPVGGNVATNDGTIPAGATFTKASDPAHGTVALNPDGTYTYTPAAGYAGPDSFSYDLCTAAPVVCSRATVSLFVVGAADDSNSGLSGAPVHGSVAGNDVVPAGAVFSGPTSGPAHGTVTMNPDGSYTYTSTAGYVGTDSFQYQVCAGSVCTTATVTILVALPQPVPALSSWGLLLMSLLVALAGWGRRRTL